MMYSIIEKEIPLTFKNIEDFIFRMEMLHSHIILPIAHLVFNGKTIDGAEEGEFFIGFGNWFKHDV